MQNPFTSQPEFFVFPIDLNHPALNVLDNIEVVLAILKMQSAPSLFRFTQT
jgi:hypothetical protein